MMFNRKEKNEFQIARKKRQTKIAAQRIKKLLIFALCFSVLVTAMYYIISEDIVGIIGDRVAASSSANNGMPLEIAGVNIRSMFECTDNIGFATDAAVFLYSQDGSKLLNYSNQMVNPVTQAMGRKFLVYDQGGTSLHVRTRDKVFFENTFDYSIIGASISENGWLAVITNAQRYASQLHIWDNSYEKEIFTWSASDEYIVDACISEETNTVSAVSISSDVNGDIVSTVKVFSMETGDLLAKKSFTDAAAISLEHDSLGNIKLICDNMAVMLNRSCTVLGTQHYTDKIVNYINSPGTDYSAILFDRYTESRTTGILVLGRNFAVSKDTAAQGKYIWADGNENGIILYSGGKTYSYDTNGNLLKIYTSESNATRVKLIGSNVYAVTRDLLYLLEE